MVASWKWKKNNLISRLEITESDVMWGKVIKKITYVIIGKGQEITKVGTNWEVTKNVLNHVWK